MHDTIANKTPTISLHATTHSVYVLLCNKIMMHIVWFEQKLARLQGM